MTFSAVIPEGNPRGTIYRYDPKTRLTTKFLEPSGMSNGLHIDKHNDLIIAQDADHGGRSVVRLNLSTKQVQVLASSFEGRKFNGPNDVTSDAQGRIYFTDARYLGQETMEMPNAVYRIDPDGKMTRIISGVLRPNGLEVSPDGKRLYVAACNAPHLPKNPNGPAVDQFGIKRSGVVVFDLDPKGEVSNGRALYSDEDGTTAVDGTAMDAEGFLYVALHNGNPPASKSEVLVISPAGKVEHLPVPGIGLATNLAFGRGADAHSLYLTTGAPWGLYRIMTNRTGLSW